VDDTHPDLTGQVIGGYDSWQDGGDGTTDTLGHGTAMASLIAGHGHGEGNGDGILGVAPKAKILSVGAMPPGDEAFKDIDALADGIRWLADNGADVIMLAYGNDQQYDSEEAAIQYAAVDKNVPVIAPSGNAVKPTKYFGNYQGLLAEYPGAYDECLTVSGSTEDGEPSEIAIHDPKVMVAAPLDDVYQALPDAKYTNEGNGTSDSAAIVAGAMALVRSSHPDLTRKQLAWQLTETADGKGGTVPNDDYGYGIVDPAKAVGPLADGMPEDITAADPLNDHAEPGTTEANGRNETDTTLSAAATISPTTWWLVAGTAVLLTAALLAVLRISKKRSRPRFDLQ
ncbi:MAG: S8 family serine peptidase, partial [Stackebrandtia sp.]